MDRYAIETVNPYDAVVTPDGMWVMTDDATAEIEHLKRLLVRASECASWHVGDGDKCGVIARSLLDDIQKAIPQQ